MSIITVKLSPIDKRLDKVELGEDKHTSDDQLKQKIRSMNLIKYNPNLFTNRNKGEFYEMMGGHRTAIFVLSGGLLGYFYKHQTNKLFGVPKRIGVWNKNFSFALGAGIGLVYSLLLFVDTQRFFNDYIAHCLFKRYPESKDLDTKNIWNFNDIENDYECYYYTKTYLNTAHV